MDKQYMKFNICTDFFCSRDLKITVGYLKVAIPVKGNANVFIGWKFEII